MAVAISLKNVRNFLYPIRLKWYDLGIELDVPGEELDEIKSKNKDDYGACLRDMITARLKFRDDPLTWGHLEAALKARAINEPGLAEEAKKQQSVFNQAKNDTPHPVPRSESTPSNTKRMHNTWTAAIREVPGYHGIMGSETAERMLKRTQSDSHLIRCSDSNGEYILSVLKRGANGPICRHFVIKTKLHDSSLYTVEGSDMTFHEADEMLEYFRKNPISYEINSIGEPMLPRMRSKTISAEPSWKFPSKTKIDTITELSCYHGALRGEEAEKKLKQQPGDSHLIRYSDSNEEYILSVLMRDVCQHFIIKTLPPPHDKYSCTMEGSDRVFPCASEMLKYFREHPISYEISGIGKPCNHNLSKATHYSSQDDSDISDDWISTRLTPPPLVTKPQRSRSF